MRKPDYVEVLIGTLVLVFVVITLFLPEKEEAISEVYAVRDSMHILFPVLLSDDNGKAMVAEVAFQMSEYDTALVTKIQHLVKSTVREYMAEYDTECYEIHETCIFANCRKILQAGCGMSISDSRVEWISLRSLSAVNALTVMEVADSLAEGE